MSDNAELTAEQQAVKLKVTQLRGGWTDAWDPILRLDPEFMDAYAQFSAVPWKHSTLEPKVREFVYIASNASATHLQELGIRNHMVAALKVGATREELMEVLELTSIIGIHTLNVGLPILVDVVAQGGRDGDLTQEQEGLKADFIKYRGYWSDSWDLLLRENQDLFAAYLQYSSVPWKTGTLEPKVKEFIYLAVNAATTHLYEPGIRVHAENALRLGATAQELMEVLELVSVLGIHTLTVGGPILEEVLADGDA